MFKLKYVFYTLLNEDEVAKKLSKHIVGGNIDNPQIETFYTGNIDIYKREFTLLRITDESGNDRVRPQVFGQYSKWKEYTKVEISFTVPGTGGLKYLLFFIGIIIFIWAYFLDFIGPKPYIYVIVPGYLILTSVFIVLGIYSKCAGNLILLKKILHNVDIKEQ